MSSTKFLINSRHFRNRTSPHDLTIYPTDFPELGSGMYLCLVHISFPNLYPTVKTGVNDQLQLYVNGTTYTVVVSEGYYTGTTLATELQTAIQTIGALNTSTVAYDTIGLKLTFTFTTKASFVNLTPTSEGQIMNPVERMYEIIGLSTAQVNSPVSSLITAYQVRLEGTSYVAVGTNFSSATYDTSPGHINVIDRIGMGDVSYGYMMTRRFTPVTKGPMMSREALQHLRFLLVDEWSQPFVVPPNHSVCYHFELFPVQP